MADDSASPEVLQSDHDEEQVDGDVDPEDEDVDGAVDVEDEEKREGQEGLDLDMHDEETIGYQDEPEADQEDSVPNGEHDEEEEEEDEEDAGDAVDVVEDEDLVKDIEPVETGKEEKDGEKGGELLTRPPHGSEVFVGGITRDTTEEDLRNLCQSSGDIYEVRRRSIWALLPEMTTSQNVTSLLS